MLLVLALVSGGFAGSSGARAEVLTLPQTSHRRCVTEHQSSACFEIGDLYQHTSKPGDIALGNQYVRFGCKLEQGRPCAQAEANAHAAAFLKAKKDWDETKRKALNEMDSVKTKEVVDCENGQGAACHGAGIHYFYLANPSNPEKGQAMFEAGCRLGDKKCCDSLELIKKGIVHVYEVVM